MVLKMGDGTNISLQVYAGAQWFTLNIRLKGGIKHKINVTVR